MSEPFLIANVGAEEAPPDTGTGEWAAPDDAPPAVAAVAALWRRAFSFPNRRPPFATASADGEADAAPAETAVAWLNTEAAAREASAAGAALIGASPDVVTRVHDKAFAHRVAVRERLVPPALRDVIEVFEPRDLAPSEAGIARIQAALDAWPAWARVGFTLKPRFSCSGRGRVAGRDGNADTPEIRGALPRLAARGGALLEPWLDRSVDLSAQIQVAAAGTADALVLLGTLEQLVTPAGVFRGHRGFLDSKGRVVSGTEHDESLREAAIEVALAAQAEGYRGPCGIDAFAFRSPEGDVRLRPVVELNARFTMGSLAIALAKEARAAVKRALGLPPERRVAFHFGLEAPPGGWPPEREGLLVFHAAASGIARASTGGPAAADDRDPCPALIVAADAPLLEAALGDVGFARP